MRAPGTWLGDGCRRKVTVGLPQFERVRGFAVAIPVAGAIGEHLKGDALGEALEQQVPAVAESDGIAMDAVWAAQTHEGDVFDTADAEFLRDLAWNGSDAQVGAGGNSHRGWLVGTKTKFEGAQPRRP